jgi:hypothetical protein
MPDNCGRISAKRRDVARMCFLSLRLEMENFSYEDISHVDALLSTTQRGQKTSIGDAEKRERGQNWPGKESPSALHTQCHRLH